MQAVNCESSLRFVHLAPKLFHVELDFETHVDFVDILIFYVSFLFHNV